MRDDPIDIVRAVDDLFLRIAGHVVEPGEVADLVEDFWALFERGDFRLVLDGDLRMELVDDDDDERRAVALQNWPLVLTRRATLWMA